MLTKTKPIKTSPGKIVFNKDQEIANAVRNALKWDRDVPYDRVKVTVKEGHLTLSGEVESWFQKNASYNAVAHLYGVTGISNQIVVKPVVKPEDIKLRIRNTFYQAASSEVDQIKVEVDGDQIILNGVVRSPIERKDAEYTAASAPGVSRVINYLVIK